MDENYLNWPAAPLNAGLDEDDIHVWRISLEVSDDAAIRLLNVLAPAERWRARSFRFERDRRRFIAGRGIMRTILGRYLSAHPSTVDLVTGPHGKPGLAETFAWSALHFNLAHSADLALLAVTRGRPVGVDLERIDGIGEPQELAPNVCSPSEQAEFSALAPGEQDVAFARIWTRKEAWLKATGAGICNFLRDVEVSFRANDAARFIRLPDEQANPQERWSLRELEPAPGFMAAVATIDDAAHLSCWNFEEEEEYYYA